ncbi:cytochrome C oxidase subunit IV family protein [Shewanella abyssi]|uniref:cytochrome C oxidase subunit IV family protein n=1 Tax=Shewanella abyssi TaxID=311789 RepID=UPI00200C0E20|nr:cytochrome C oxidase subunit IV family protein [Shewanella abyssi]MCL1050155.1 cytochrome C oxidase subunit IV family protein [Shewanella abyssi]
MKSLGKIEFYWGALIAITLFNTFLGEQFESSALVSVLVALTVMYKGLMVIDHFMELRHAHKYLRLMMRFYLIFFPSLIILTAFF